MNRDPYLPLTETTYYTLVALMEPCHGYKILGEVKKLSNGQVHLAPGTLYGALENLEKQGLITLVEEEGPRKKIFQIADIGLEVLKKDQLRLMHMANLLSKDQELALPKEKSSAVDKMLTDDKGSIKKNRTGTGRTIIKKEDEADQKKYITGNKITEKIKKDAPGKKKREEDLFY